MKRSLLTSLACGLLLSLPAWAQHEGHHSGSTVNSMMKVMEANMTRMRAIKPTGDADHDFASIMKMHHQGAVDMVNAYTPQAKNAEMKTMARRMNTMQKKEIQDFTAFLSGHKPQSSTAQFGRKSMQMMHKGDSHAMSGNPDQDFVAMMSEHHQMGIDMANAFLKEAKTEKMRGMAQSIIREQTKEIKDMQDWQAKNKG